MPIYYPLKQQGICWNWILCLQMAPFADAPEEVDQTIFTKDKNQAIGIASKLAQDVVEEAHRYIQPWTWFVIDLTLILEFIKQWRFTTHYKKPLLSVC